MNEDIDEIYDDNPEGKKDFKEVVDKEFEPMGKIRKGEEIFDNFEPKDELINVNIISMNEFEPSLYINNRKDSTEKQNHLSEKQGVDNLQKLYNNGRVKECGRCHQIKPYNEFGARVSNGKKRIFSCCKECRIEMNQIYQYRNKVKIIQNIYNGKLNGKCQTYSTDVKRLPALEFHHINPKLKGLKRISLYRNWEQTKTQIEKEKAILLCVNCHTKQRSKYYLEYEKTIQESNLSPLSNNNQINQYVKNKLPNADYEVRRQISRNIKKQIVINQLYSGKCVGCGDMSIENNLPALQFHHRDKQNPYKMSKTYVNLRNLEIIRIISKLKQEDCIILCGNCHRMVQSTYFKKRYEQIINPEHWDQIKKDFERIEKNIENFKFK